jgi:hypothetical protein
MWLLLQCWPLAVLGLVWAVASRLEDGQWPWPDEDWEDSKMR